MVQIGIEQGMRTLAIVLILALPLAADDEKKTAKETTTSPAAATSPAPAAAPAVAAPPAAQPDSPLVAASKRANRLGKKPRNVITNDSLKTSGASTHITTTAKQTEILMPVPVESAEIAAAKQRQEKAKQAAEQAEKDRKAKEEQAKKTETEAAAREEGYDGMQDDAAEFVGTNPPPPQF